MSVTYDAALDYEDGATYYNGEPGAYYDSADIDFDDGARTYDGDLLADLGFATVSLLLEVDASGAHLGAGAPAVGFALDVEASGDAIRARAGSAATSFGLTTSASGAHVQVPGVGLTLLHLTTSAAGLGRRVGPAAAQLELRPAGVGGRLVGGSASAGLGLAVSAQGQHASVVGYVDIGDQPRAQLSIGDDPREL